MTAIDLRNENWDSMKARLHTHRLAVYDLWAKHGPCTTRELAQRCDDAVSLLTIRPRTTELLQLGFVALTGSDKGQGIYQARSMEEAEAHFQRKLRAAVQPPQLDLFARGGE